MFRSPAPELPAEVLELIFTTRQPGGEPEAPVLLSDKERLRCQLVCKSWRHALSAQRWPLGQLALLAEPPTFIPPLAALWVQRAQPGVQRLRIALAGDELYSEEGPLGLDNPTVEAVYDAVLALQPSVLEELSLWAPFDVLELFIPSLGRFIGLRQLRLEAESVRRVGVHTEGVAQYYDYEYYAPDVDCVDEVAFWTWDYRAVLRTPLLHHLPSQLERLTLCNFMDVRIDQAVDAAGSADGDSKGSGSRGNDASSATPPVLLPALTRLHISSAEDAVLSAPLPSLVELTIQAERAYLSSRALLLPQLTSLQLVRSSADVPLRCAAMPALAQLVLLGCRARACDNWQALQHVTHLDLSPVGRFDTAVIRGLAGSLRSLSAALQPGTAHTAPEQVAALAAAGAVRLTRLEINSPACLPHLPAWPELQELVLSHVRPTSIPAQQLAVLVGAPSLRRLQFANWSALNREAELAKIEELRQALPHCSVEC